MDGNVWISDSDNNRIRKVDQNGIISTIAGNGESGSLGDNGPANRANLLHPGSIALDPIGNLYVRDNGNKRIRKIDPNGIISTIAGNGGEEFAGENIPAVSASLSTRNSIEVDGMGNLFISDRIHHCIRMVDTNGIISTIAGDGKIGFSGDNGLGADARLSFPAGMAIDSLGNLFIAVSSNGRIRKIDRNGVITTVVGNGGFSGDGGPAANASLSSPVAVALDREGNLFFADLGNNRINKVDSNGVLSIVAGNGERGFSEDGIPAVDASLPLLQGIAIDREGNLLFADPDTNRIRKVDANGILSTVVENGESGISVDGGSEVTHLGSPEWITLDTQGNLYFTDNKNRLIYKMNTEGRISKIAGNGRGDFFEEGVLATNTSLPPANSLATDPSGNLFFTSGGAIFKVNVNGIISTVATPRIYMPPGGGGLTLDSGFAELKSIAVDSKGNLFVADMENNFVFKVEFEPALINDFSIHERLGFQFLKHFKDETG